MWTARVITCSDAASRGEREDRSGPAVRGILLSHDFEAPPPLVVSDDVAVIAEAIRRAVDEEGADLVVTTGGTGISQRDVTPEATMQVCEKKIDGFGELMRLRSLEKTPMAPLSRAGAATRGSALVVNLPGSVAGAVENLEAVIHLIPHALELLRNARVERHPGAS